MFGLTGQKLTNALVIDNEGVSLFSWKNKVLSQMARYTLEEDELDAFYMFMESQRHVPLVVVVDCIEEDFRVEMIAHVSSSDRKELLKRKLTHLFRNNPYSAAKVFDREKSGRKDDKALLTALTKPELLDPWLSRVLQLRIPVRVMTSAAYVLESLVQSAGLKKEAHLLLVNHEYTSGLRQTYLQHGRVMFSRLIPASVRQSGSFENLVEYQADQTRKYLERIKQVPYDALLNVQVYSAMREDTPEDKLNDLMHVNYGSMDDLISRTGCQFEMEYPGAVAVALVQSLQRRSLKNVYGPLMTLRYFYLKVIRKALFTASAAIIVATLALAFPTLLDAELKRQQQLDLTAITQPLVVQYETMRERFPETPIPSSQMALVVKTYSQIQSQIFQPQSILDALGGTHLFSQNLQLISISWELRETGEDALAASYTGFVQEQEAELFQKAVVAGKTELVITLNGRVRSQNGRREAREKVLALISAIEDNPKYTITPIMIPVNPGTNIPINTKIDDAALVEEFQLEIRPRAVN